MTTITYARFEDAVARVVMMRLHITRAAVCTALRTPSSFDDCPEAQCVQALLDAHLKPHPSLSGVYVP